MIQKEIFICGFGREGQLSVSTSTPHCCSRSCMLGTLLCLPTPLKPTQHMQAMVPQKGKETTGTKKLFCFGAAAAGRAREVSLAGLHVCTEFRPPALPCSPGRRHYGSQLWPQLWAGRSYLAFLLLGACQAGYCFVEACWGVFAWWWWEGASGGMWGSGFVIANINQQKKKCAFSGLCLWGLSGFLPQQKWGLSQMKLMCLQYGPGSEPISCVSCACLACVW